MVSRIGIPVTVPAAEVDRVKTWIADSPRLEALAIRMGITLDMDTMSILNQYWNAGYRGDMHMMDWILLAQEVFGMGYAARAK
jgi:hypothetical protein